MLSEQMPTAAPNVLAADLQRLRNYAERIVEHAVLALHSCHVGGAKPSLAEDFYRQGLLACRELSPAAVEECGVKISGAMIAAAPKKEQNEFMSELASLYYCAYPLSERFSKHVTQQDISLWFATSDISEFVRSFSHKTVDEIDPRSIGDCLQFSLTQNNLVDAYNALDIVAMFASAQEDGQEQPVGIEIWGRPAGHGVFNAADRRAPRP